MSAHVPSRREIGAARNFVKAVPKTSFGWLRCDEAGCGRLRRQLLVSLAKDGGRSHECHGQVMRLLSCSEEDRYRSAILELLAIERAGEETPEAVE
jgi:hypothetical protein